MGLTLGPRPRVSWRREHAEDASDGTPDKKPFYGKAVFGNGAHHDAKTEHVGNDTTNNEARDKADEQRYKEIKPGIHFGCRLTGD